VAEAERLCAADARLAERPRGEVRFGVAANDGNLRPTGGITLDLSSDYLAGRDPEDVWRRCVYNRSGQLPTRSFASLPPQPPAFQRGGRPAL
jgi:hypothetical protein